MSFLPKKEQLKELLYRNICEMPDIFGVSETFLNADIYNKELVINGYSVLRRDRVDRGGGGILVYVRQNLLFIHRTDLQTDDVETIWIEIRPLHSKPYLICNVYRPPDSTNQWFSSFKKQISTAVETNNELIVLVDFNMNISNSNSKDKLWKMIIENYNFKGTHTVSK